jgi:hypothetical protein
MLIRLLAIASSNNTIYRFVTISGRGSMPRHDCVHWALNIYSVHATSAFGWNQRNVFPSRLNSHKGKDQNSHRIFRNLLCSKIFGISAAPKGSCLVDQFWGLNTVRILQALLRKVVPSKNVSPHKVYRMHRSN